MTDTTALDLVPNDDIPDSEEGLLAYLSDLIEQSKRVASAQVNTTLTMRNWLIGRAINTLHNQRADYGKQIYVSLAHKLTKRFGPGFDQPTLSRMTAFNKDYPDFEIGVSLAHRLSWTHILALLPVKSAEARDFYVLPGHSRP
jgi:ABC-type microcin C transport system permease subunit YejB